MKIIRSYICLFLSVVILIGVCGCNMSDNFSSLDNSNERNVLTERQVDILEKEGLPINYDELTDRQRKTIDDIECKFKYLDKKYDNQFEFIGYTLERNSEYGYLTVYPVNGNKDIDSFKVYSDDGKLKDTYINVLLRPILENEIKNSIVNEMKTNELLKVFVFVNDTSLEQIPDSFSNIDCMFNLQITIFVGSDTFNKSEFEEFVCSVSSLLKDKKMYGTAYFNLFQEDIDLLTQYNYPNYLSNEYRADYKYVGISK